MKDEAAKPPRLDDSRVPLRSFGDKPLSHVERTATGLSEATPGGFYEIVDAGRTADAFGLTMVEFASYAKCDLAKLMPPPPTRSKLPYGAIRTPDGFIRATFHRPGWRAQIGRRNSAGIVKWRAVGTLKTTHAEALRLARKVKG